MSVNDLVMAVFPGHGQYSTLVSSTTSTNEEKRVPLMVRSSHSCLFVFRGRGLGGASSCWEPSEVKGMPSSTGTLTVLLLSSSVRVVSAMLGGLVVWMPLRLRAELLICWIS